MLYQPMLFIDSPHDNKSLVNEIEAMTEDIDDFSVTSESSRDLEKCKEMA